jgi:hypothetical protein
LLTGQIFYDEGGDDERFYFYFRPFHVAKIFQDLGLAVIMGVRTGAPSIRDIVYSVRSADNGRRSHLLQVRLRTAPLGKLCKL